MTAPQTFTTAGAISVTVPADASIARIECWGAAGNNQGGKGGYAKGDLSVIPGGTLLATVGGVGVRVGGSGRASDVRVGGSALANRVIVAGGGGGGAIATGGGGGTADPIGGTGGGVVGGAAYWSGTEGGTQSAGGAANGAGSTAGSLGVGGFGDYRMITMTVGGYQAVYGGDGGDGYYGGGGAAFPAAGGGGSGFVGGVTNSLMSSGVRTGAGQVIITWLNTAPLAPTLTAPATGASTLVPPTLGWTFADPDAGDAQSKADIQYRLAGAGTWTSLPAATTTATTYTFGAGVITTGSSWEWQVRTYDRAGVVGPWSASSFFNAVAVPPAPTITVPASGATLTDTPTPVTWTVPAGQTQSAYQVQRCSDAIGTLVYADSGQVTSTALATTIGLDMVFGRTDFFRVRYFASVWSTWASVSAITYAGPPQAALVVCTPDPVTASVRLVITNPPQAAGFASAVSNDIARTSPDGSTVRIAKGLPPGATFVDWKVGAGLNTYKVTTYAASGSTSVSA